MRHLPFIAILLLSAPLALPAAEKPMKFDFGSTAHPGITKASRDAAFDAKLGYGWENGGATFAIQLPEGNYDVKVRLGDPTAAAETTVKAEARRLMLDRVKTAPGQMIEGKFTVNLRRPEIGGGGEVSLKDREKGAAAWDDRLTLEFLGEHAAVSALEITPAQVALTIYLAGDSTVTDQGSEPWAGWGQMLPRFFQPGVAISNHSQSGLSLGSFRGGKRLAKVLSTMKRGDYFFIQFGHNDQKEKAPAGPFTTYKDNLKDYVTQGRDAGGIPVLVTPMERRRWSGGKPQETLTDFAEAVRQSGKELDVPVIDLHAASLKLYEALGAEDSKRAFVHYPAGTYPGQDKDLKDDTHHNSYGGYELARCMVEGIRTQVPALAKLLREDAGTFDPMAPDAPETFTLPASSDALVEKPAGN